MKNFVQNFSFELSSVQLSEYISKFEIQINSDPRSAH